MLALLLAVQIVLPNGDVVRDEADLAWAARQVRADTVIVLSYPTGRGSLYRVCTVMYRQGSSEELTRRCWTPKDPRFEIDVWENWVYAGHVLVVELTVNDHGVYRTYHAVPLPEEGTVRECGGDACP